LKASQARTNALQIGVSDTMQIREVGNHTVASVNGVKGLDQAADQLLLSGSRFAHFSGSRVSKLLEVVFKTIS
jgi:hypothetical protein